MSEIKKKILIATGIFPPEIGGPATYSKLLLDELPQRGYEVTVLPFSTVRHLPPIVRHLVYCIKVIQLGSRVDIIYAQDPVSVGLPVALANILLGKKFILKVVGDFAWEQASGRGEIFERLDDFKTCGGRYSLKTRVHRLIQRFVLREAERIIVPSEYLKRMVSRYLSAGQQSKIKVIYNAFAPVEIVESKKELRAQLDFTGPVIISAGRLVSWKGFSMLIDLLSKLRMTSPDTRLLIVGSGPDEGKLKAQVAAAGLSGAVEIVGQLGHADLLRRIKGADIFALNTNYEGLSHVLLEAMALGTPIVTTPAGGNTELIKNGETGLVASFDNQAEWQAALEKLLGNQALAGEIASRAQDFVQNNFSRERMINSLVAELI